MALVQKGYLGRTGPIFVDDSAVPGKYIVFMGTLVNGVMRLLAKQPNFAANLPNFPYTPAQCTLSTYVDNQDVMISPAYTQPATGTAFDDYYNVSDASKNWTAVVPAVATVGTTTTGTTNTGTTGTTNTGTTGTGTSVVTDTNAAPTFSEQVTTFVTNYWWVIAIALVVLLWKPFIAPALGMGGKGKRKSYR